MHRSLVLWAGLAALSGCKKDDAASVPAAPSTAEVDSLWALAPVGARGGLVASPRAVGMVEDGLAMVRGVVDQAPELAVVKDMLDTAMVQLGGKPDAKLADMGMTRDKGVALFAARDGEMVAVLPVADRAKFIDLVKGTKGATPQDADLIGDVTCRAVQQVYACAKPAALLDTLGKGELKSYLGTLAKGSTVRGDIEIVGIEIPLGEGQKGTLVQVAQLERGGATIRGSFVGLSPELAARIGKPAKPRPESAQSVSFAVLDLKSFVGDAPLVATFGEDIAAVMTHVNGSTTVTVPAGATGIDARFPLSDGAAAQKLVERCAEIPGFTGATLKDNVCHVPLPEASLELDIWLDADKKTLRVGQKGMKPGPFVPISKVGRELASGTWSMAFWGRGTVMGASTMPGIPGTVDAQTALILRALSLLNEVGMGLKVDGNKLDFVMTVRTAFANPDPVIAKLVEITPHDIAGARANDKAKAIATSNASTPFAQDYKAGQMGLAIPYMMIGTVAAIAIPAFMNAMRGPEPMAPTEMPPDIAPPP